MKGWSQKRLPSLHKSGVKSGNETEEILDFDTIEMMNEVDKDIERMENDANPQGSDFYNSVRATFRKSF